MDSTNASSINGTHLQQQQQYNGPSSFSNFINEIDAYASADDGVTNNDDYTSFPWDPALFAGGESNSTFPPQQQQQPSQSMPANLNQTLTRQSNSPALQQHHPPQSQYPQNNYGHSLYEPRNMAQPSFDERFMSRPSVSPASFDHASTYQQMPYNNYNYQPQYQRQTPTPTPYYPQRPVQPSQPMMNIAARPSPQMSQPPQGDNVQFHQYQNNQRIQHTFVNPSMVNSSHMVAMSGAQQSDPNRSNPQQYYAASPYFMKAGSTAVDPQLLHAMQNQNHQPIQTSTPQNHQQPGLGLQPLQPQNLTIAASNQQRFQAESGMQSKAAKDPAAPKRSKPKSNKVKKDGTGESDSSDELEIEDEPPETKPMLLVVSAPTDEKGKALYNAVEAVWYPRNKSPPAEDVRKGIAAFGETVRSLRDAWKAKNESLKKAELPNSETASQASRLKEDVAHYRQTMESVISRSLQFGHDAIVKRLGENQFTLSALYSFLLDRANVGDYDSTLVSSIFKFAVKFETLDEEMLEQVKWAKVLQRWTKKATNESKETARKILTNAAAATARKNAAKADGAPGSPASVNGNRKDGVAGMKRPREMEFGSTLPVKKPVKQASKPLALQSAERRKALERETAQKSANLKGEKIAANGNSAVASRPKVAMTAPSKANAFAGFLSASKKPGTSNAEKAAAAAAASKDKPSTLLAGIPSQSLTAITKDETLKKSPPRSLGPDATKSASSFMGVLADMDKPKETQSKKVEVDPLETEEQRVKRLRKEARRKLRVTWKPDDDLVQTKLFTHDPDEETGQTDSMMRDAGDTMKEGEMLKRHMAMEDVDEDEEEEVLDETAEYTSPSEVDFTIIDADCAANYVKFGGPVKPESIASEAQDKYEENTLMTTYAFKSDRPDTPKELPSVNDDDDFSPVVDFGEPSDKVRRREKDILARKTTQVAAAPGIDLAAQLRAMGVQQTQIPQPSGFNLANLGQQPTQPAAATQVPPGLDLSKLLAVMQQHSQMQQAQQQPQAPQPPQIPAYQQPATAGVPPSLAALVAQVSGQQASALPVGNSGNPNPFPANDEFSRKHGRDIDSNNDQANKKKKKGTDGKPYNYKTQICHFWTEGKCTKGENCTYKHEL